MTAPASSTPEVNAADVMSTPVATVSDQGTIWDAWSVLISCRVRHAVVVSGSHCVAVVNDRDLVDAWQQGPSVLRRTPLRSLLRDRTSCVLPDASLSQVAELMNADRVDAVPVVDVHGELLGLVTAGDIVHAVARYGLHAAGGDPRDQAVQTAPRQ
jgi:CBS domain-containing protein